MSAATRTSPASSSRSSTDSSNPRANESHSRDPATSAPTLNSRTGTSVFAERTGRAQINAARLVAQDVKPSDKAAAVGVAFSTSRATRPARRRTTSSYARCSRFGGYRPSRFRASREHSMGDDDRYRVILYSRRWAVEEL
jgi:hypothetical protein